jgi:ATP-dependent Clp protease adaptor protein ClpS
MTSEVKTKEQTEVSIKQPSLWKVVFLNDDSTPMEFVIELLVTIFKHSVDTAKEITLEVHNSGSAVVGVYTHEIAEQKGIEATAIARVAGYPLQIDIEEE